MCRQAIFQRHFELLGGLGRVVEVRQRHARQRLARHALDRLEVIFFLRRHERERFALQSGAGGAAHSMDVVFRDHGHVEVDDVAQRLDVDAARRNVGRDQDAIPAFLEPLQRINALVLRPVAVDARRIDAVLGEELPQAVGAMLGAREHQRFLDEVAIEDREQQRRLELLRHRIRRLRDARRRLRDALDVDLHRIVQEFTRELQNRRRHRRAEEERLALWRQVFQHALDVRQEAHVQHPVGFVQDQELDLVELGVRMPEVVKQPARRRDDHVDTGAQGMLLLTHADAAVDGRCRERRVDRELVQVLKDLRGQFTRRRDDQRARGAARLVQQPVQNGQQERGGFAAAGHGAGNQVAPLERRRNRVRLDGRGTREAEVFDTGEETRVELECTEWHQGS